MLLYVYFCFFLSCSYFSSFFRPLKNFAILIYWFYSGTFPWCDNKLRLFLGKLILQSMSFLLLIPPSPALLIVVWCGRSKSRDGSRRESKKEEREKESNAERAKEMYPLWCFFFFISGLFKWCNWASGNCGTTLALTTCICGTEKPWPVRLSFFLSSLLFYFSYRSFLFLFFFPSFS